MNLQPESPTIQAAQTPLESPSRWYMLLLLVFGYIVYALDKQIIAVLIEPIKKEFSLSDTTLSLLGGMAVTLPAALACIPIGMLADRRNRKNLLVVLIIAWSLTTGMAGLATSVVLLFASRMGVGAFESGFTPLSLSIISDTFSQKTRATAMGIFSLGIPVGIFLGLALGGYVAAEYGWRAAFFMAGVPGLLLALCIALTVKEPQRGRFDPPSDNTGSVPLKAVLTNIWRDSALFNLLAGMVFCAVMPAAVSIWTPSFLIRLHGMDVKQASLSAALAVGVCGAVGAAVGGFVADRIGADVLWRKLISPAVGVLLSVVFAVLAFQLVGHASTVVVLLGCLCFFGQAFLGTGYSVVTSLCPTAMRGTTLSILFLTFNLGSYGLGTLLVGMLSDFLQPSVGAVALSYAFMAATLFSLVGVCFILRSLFQLRSRLKTTALEVRA